jgi:hypothetical protein
MTKLKFLIAAAITCLASASVLAQNALVGTWQSVTAPKGALEGAIDLKSDHTLTLRAKTQPEFTGTWHETGVGRISFTIAEAGTSEMGYQLKKSKLTLTYDNGDKQEFVRQSSKPKLGKKP